MGRGSRAARREADLVRRCYAGLDGAAFQAGAVRAIHALLPVDAVFFATADPVTLLFTGAAADDPLAAATAQFLDNEFGHHDVNKFQSLAAGAQHVATLDAATRGQRAASARYREIMSPLGLGDELRAALVTPAGCWGYLCLHRADSPHGFTPAEVRLIGRLAPHLGNGCRHSLTVPPRDPSGMTATAPGVVVLHPDLTVAAIATAVDERGEPDCARSVALAGFLLAHGCDGLNVLGTTGEATSFSLEQRKRVMTAYRDAGLPLDRLMVGTGAASVADAIALTRHAAELGFAGALVLPPFYYKGVPDDGLVAYVEAIVTATAAKPIPIYLYHFPAQSGLPWHVRLVKRLIEAFGTRIVGLKDSSGDMAYAREAAALSPRFDVFPSTEAVLMQARSGMFAGCISATANLNADLCARVWRSGDAGALDAAVAIRKLFDGKPLVPGVKALLAHIHGDAAWARVKPPLTAFSASEQAAVAASYDGLRMPASPSSKIAAASAQAG